jgi:hypothetical protein
MHPKLLFRQSKIIVYFSPLVPGNLVAVFVATIMFLLKCTRAVIFSCELQCFRPNFKLQSLHTADMKRYGPCYFAVNAASQLIRANNSHFEIELLFDS